MSKSQSKGEEPPASAERELHWLFEDPRCRTTLEVLEDASPPIDLQALAERITYTEPSLSPSDERAVEDVTLALHHSHLPKMDRLGIIEYDATSNRVEAWIR